MYAYVWTGQSVWNNAALSFVCLFECDLSEGGLIVYICEKGLHFSSFDEKREIILSIDAKKIHNNQDTSWCYYVKREFFNDEITEFYFTYFWLFSKQQLPHRSLPHPGPNSSRSSLLQATSSWSTNFRLFPAITLTVWGVLSKITLFVFGEFIDNAERRGESPVGHGEGVVDHVKWGVGGWEAAEAVHVREHTVHITDRHLVKKKLSSNEQENVAWSWWQAAIIKQAPGTTLNIITESHVESTMAWWTDRYRNGSQLVSISSCRDFGWRELRSSGRTLSS